MLLPIQICLPAKVCGSKGLLDGETSLPQVHKMTKDPCFLATLADRLCDGRWHTEPKAYQLGGPKKQSARVLLAVLGKAPRMKPLLGLREINHHITI